MLREIRLGLKFLSIDKDYETNNSNKVYGFNSVDWIWILIHTLEYLCMTISITVDCAVNSYHE